MTDRKYTLKQLRGAFMAGKFAHNNQSAAVDEQTHDPQIDRGPLWLKVYAIEDYLRTIGFADPVGALLADFHQLPNDASCLWVKQDICYRLAHFIQAVGIENRECLAEHMTRVAIESAKEFRSWSDIEFASEKKGGDR